jgi:hypothetical protein
MAMFAQAEVKTTLPHCSFAGIASAIFFGLGKLNEFI